MSTLLDHFNDVEVEKLRRELFDPQNQCQTCSNGSFCSRDIRFCSFCGTKNPNFDEIELTRQSGKNLADFLEECREGHSEEKGLILKYPDQTYCMFCGELLQILQ